jgi:alanine racemase
MRSPHITVTVNLAHVRQRALALKAETGVKLMAVIKADAYGLGAAEVAAELAPVVDDFAFFSVDEAYHVRVPALILGPPNADPGDFRELQLRPTITTPAEADRYRGLPCAINIDLGMQRFGAPPESLDALAADSHVVEVMSHGTDPEIGPRLQELCGDRFPRLHVACSHMLPHPQTWLDLIRPGVALYRGALRVTTTLSHVRDTYGPAGYTGFQAPRVGLFQAGYAEGIQPGPVIVNRRRQRIIEVNMNASFVTLAPQDQVGDEVVLLGDDLREPELAAFFNIRDHEVITRFSALGLRRYVHEASAPEPTPAATAVSEN